MNFATKIAAAALVAVSMGAMGAQAQNAPAPQQQQQAQPEWAPLTVAQVKTVVEGRLVMMRTDLKVGKVTEKDAKTYDVELLKSDGTVQEHALVDKIFARPAGALSHGGHGFGHGFGGMRDHGGMGYGGMGNGPMGCGRAG